MRIDRALTLLVARPLRGLVPSDAAASIPILMYHSISSKLDDTVRPYFRTVTSPKSFALQIELLHAGGYETITLSQAISLLGGSSAEASHVSRKVVLTFDDGFRDFHTDAFPILERAGFTATVFLASDFIGKPFITGRDCLTAAEIRLLSDRGIEFGSHSASHRRLVDLRTDELAKELSRSKARIEDIVGREVSHFSYPFRFPEQNPRFIATLTQLLDEYGYEGGVTTTIGRSSRQEDRRFLPRLPVNDCDDAELLHAKVSGHYDWLRSGQRLRKQSRAVWHEWTGA